MLRALIALALVAIPATARAQSADITPENCRMHWEVPLISTEIPGRANALHITLLGNVVIECKDLKVYADQAEGDTDGDIVTLRGNVVLEQTGLRVYADHAEIFRKTHNGTFFEVHGTSQTSVETADQDQFGGTKPDIAFWASELSKTGPETFELRDGAFTSCVQATPRWSVAGTSGTFVRDHRVSFWNAVIRVKGVPVFYVPYIYYPITKEDRSTGFLMPSFGSSGSAGFTLSNAFFWAISRNTDATFYQEYLKRAGTGFGAEYRFVSAPGSNGDISLHTLRQRGKAAVGSIAAQPAFRSYSTTAHLNQGLTGSLRLVGLTNYFTDVTSQHLFNQNVLDQTNMNRTVDFSLTGSRGRYRYTANYAQTDVYTFTGDTSFATRRGYGPRLAYTMSDAPVGHSHLYFGAAAESAYLKYVTDLDNPSTNHNLWRFDAKPRVQMPLSKLSFLTVTTSAAWEVTEWLESIDLTTNTQEATPLTRQLFNAEVRMVGPVFARVWQPKGKYADRVKHVIEPTFGVQWFSPFDRSNEVVRIDGIDSIVGGTTTTTYGVANRFMVRKRGTEATPGPVREIVTLDIAQSHYTNSLASTVDAQYQPCATGAFSAVHIALAARPSDRITGQFNTDINPQFHTPCTISAGATITSRPTQLTLGWSKREYIPGLSGFDNPAFADEFLNATATYKRANGHVGGTYNTQYDMRLRRLAQQRLGVFYNSQCCGLSVDYQVRDISYLGQPNRQTIRQFNFAFTLAGIGSFANPLGSFGSK